MHSARELLECMFLQFWDALVAGVVGDKLSPSEQASKENTACPFLVNGDSFAHSNLNANVQHCFSSSPCQIHLWD